MNMYQPSEVEMSTLINYMFWGLFGIHMPIKWPFARDRTTVLFPSTMGISYILSPLVNTKIGMSGAKMGMLGQFVKGFEHALTHQSWRYQTWYNPINQSTWPWAQQFPVSIFKSNCLTWWFQRSETSWPASNGMELKKPDADSPV